MPPLIRQDQDRSIGELLGQLSEDMGLLVRQEVQLARTEIGEKVSTLTGDLVSLGAGAMVAHTGAMALVAALILLLVSLGITAWFSALIIGGVLAGAGYSMILKGRQNLKRADLTPTRTMATLKDDVQWAKEQRP